MNEHPFTETEYIIFCAETFDIANLLNNNRALNDHLKERILSSQMIEENGFAYQAHPITANFNLIGLKIGPGLPILEVETAFSANIVSYFVVKLLAKDPI